MLLAGWSGYGEVTHRRLSGEELKLGVLGVLLCVVAAVGVWALLDLSEQSAPSTSLPSAARLIAHDSSGHGNDGINQGHPRLGQPGHRGTSYSFDRPGSWSEVSSAGDLNPGVGSFTLSAWVRLSSLPERHGDYDIIRKGLSTTAEYKVEVMRGGAVRCTAKDAAGHRARVTGWEHPIAAGRWHWIGCSRTKGAWLVHVDGWSESESVRLGPIANSVSLSIGSDYGEEDAPQGQIDDVRLRVNGDTVGLWRLDEVPRG